MSLLGWILAAVLALVFAGAGAFKLSTPKVRLLQNPAMSWAADFSAGQIKAIGAVEVIGALGVVLPWLFDIAPVLTPLAALGLALVMVGAIVTHVRRGERQPLAANVVLLVLALLVMVIRFVQL